MSFCKACNHPALRDEAPENFRPGQGRWVNEAEYVRRLDICQSCPCLYGGNTCSLCGCIIKYRAALKDKCCPDPHENKWLTSPDAASCIFNMRRVLPDCVR
ncbi:MAG: hypothetical protein JXR78_03715 [Victivallales bacterium]|nr:hypothetical protein [Victivallales bacterium]